MNRQTLGIAVMLNNYFHDLAVALMASSILTAWFLRRRLGHASPEQRRFAVAIADRLGLVTRATLVWIVLGGVVRTLAYRDYEWQPAAGKGQVPALLAKHLVLIVTTIAGMLLQRDLDRRLEPERKGGREEYRG